jgi:hypothetical protein
MIASLHKASVLLDVFLTGLLLLEEKQEREVANEVISNNFDDSDLMLVVL